MLESGLMETRGEHRRTSKSDCSSSSLPRKVGMFEQQTSKQENGCHCEQALLYI
jgi:hypothetical protein